MATITCEFCNEKIKGVINYSKHLQREHKAELIKQGRDFSYAEYKNTTELALDYLVNDLIN